MKRILMTAAALTALSAAPAFATTPGAQYTFSGSVDALCTIAGHSGAVAFGALTNGSGAYTGNGASEDATDDNAYCNQANTQATITHTNLFTSNDASIGFTNVIPMDASLSTTEGGSLDDSTDATGTGTSAGSSGTIGAFTGLKVTATLGSIGTDKLVAGTYGGTITVTLTPSS
jgi:hypothetical protein